MMSASSQHRTIEETENQNEEYTLTGDFEKDFVSLCESCGLSSLAIQHRVSRPTVDAMSPDMSTSKGKEDKKNLSSEQPPVPIDPENAPPTTFTVNQNKYDYIRPKLEIETEEESNKSHVKSIYIRGWQADKRIMNILDLTLPELDHLTTLDLWNAGLNDETLLQLSVCLTQSHSLQTLNLDGNDKTVNQRFDLFIGENSNLQNLSLKNCTLNDSGAERLGIALSDNKNLVSLNLRFNKISCVGCSHIVKGLRMNRTLISLNLANNNIGDDGSKELADILTHFPLTHEEVVARRYLRSKYNGDDSRVPGYTSDSPSRGDRPSTANRSFIKKDKGSGGKKKEGNAPAKGKDAGGVKRGQSSTDATKTNKGSKAKGTSKQERLKTPQNDSEETSDFRNPLLEKTTETNGQLWIVGNRTLINLNLSRNEVGVSGLLQLLAAVRYQIEHDPEHNSATSPGLLRLSLQGNNFPADHPAYITLLDIMTTRDPFYKPVTPEAIAELDESLN